MAFLLTFDDGPGPATERLLDVLGDVKAVFFLLGANIERARATALRAAVRGHALGNHTWSHARPDAIAAPALVAEVRRTDALLAELYREAGRAPPAEFPVRLPYGPAPGDARLGALAAIGRTHTHWTGDFADWQDPDPRDLASRMRAHIDAQAALGLDAVLDLHDSSKLFAGRANTVEAVRLLLTSVQ